MIRAIAESAAKALGTQIIVDNKPGAGGMLGANELVNAKPDGYVLSQLPQGVFRIPQMQKTQFNTLTDFTWIACLTGYTFGLVVPADGPIKSLADLVAYAAKPMSSTSSAESSARGCSRRRRNPLCRCASIRMYLHGSSHRALATRRVSMLCSAPSVTHRSNLSLKLSANARPQQPSSPPIKPSCTCRRPAPTPVPS